MEKYKDKNESLGSRLEDLMSKMTVKDKINQLNQEMTNRYLIDELIEKAMKGIMGSCILADNPFAGSTEYHTMTVKDLNKIQKEAVEKTRLGIPLIFGNDVIHGARTTFPIPLAQAATWDFELIKEAASIMAREANSAGVHWTFAPMLDISRDPRWGRIIESPGEDPFLGAMYAKASVEGIQGDDMSAKGKLAACAKHYIGYGAAEGGRDYNKSEISDYLLKNIYLTAFKAAVDAGIATVMTSFNEISGQPVTSSEYHIRQLLKQELGFEGFVVSDWCSVQKLMNQGVADNEKDCALLAVKAGIDMDMVDRYYDHIEELLSEGKLEMVHVDDAVRRILRIKFMLGLFDNPYFDESESEDYMRESDLLHAKEIAMHSMILLKNEDNLLPLCKQNKVALVGPIVHEKRILLGSWSAGGRPEDVISLYEGIKAMIGEENILTSANPSWYDSIYRAVKNSDVVVVALGEDENLSGEGRCVSSVELPDYQVKFAKIAKELGKKVVSVVFNGRPVSITELMKYSDAVLYSWQPGVMAGAAVAEILFGGFVPCGRLPVTIVRYTGQIPMYYNTPNNSDNRTGYYRELGEHGNYEDVSDAPLFPFGFGLSYTSFEYSDIVCDKTALSLKEINEGNKLTLKIKIKNIGQYDGYETVQCYIRDIVASMCRPLKELKAFQKIWLEAGKEIEIKFEIGRNELAFYNNQGKFVVEPGKFIIEIAKNCVSVDRKIEINVDD